MQGFVEALVVGGFLRALSPALLGVLMAVAPRKAVRAQLKKIYVLNESGEMAGEYILDLDCPIDYDDFLRVLPDEGIGDRASVFVGEYVFTAFQSGRLVFVLLSRGQLAPEDVDWTMLLLKAASSHLAKSAQAAGPVRSTEIPSGPDRDSRQSAREADLLKLEAKLKADEANLKGREEELNRQRIRMSALAKFVTEVQENVSAAAHRANRSLELAEQFAAQSKASANEAQAKNLAAARSHFEDERKALVRARQEIEAKYDEVLGRMAQLEKERAEALAAVDRERAESARREAETEKLRAEVEVKVKDLSLKFAEMAKERLDASQKAPKPGADAATQAIETEKAHLSKERKFLQGRSIELLDREERLREREAKTAELDLNLRRREAELAARESELERKQAALAGPSYGELEEFKKDMDRRLKILQQKALDLLDREERLRKRQAELEALEARLSGRVPAQ